MEESGYRREKKQPENTRKTLKNTIRETDTLCIAVWQIGSKEMSLSLFEALLTGGVC